jgi:hypothetical protein
MHASDGEMRSNITQQEPLTRPINEAYESRDDVIDPFREPSVTLSSATLPSVTVPSSESASTPTGSVRASKRAKTASIMCCTDNLACRRITALTPHDTPKQALLSGLYAAASSLTRS